MVECVRKADELHKAGKLREARAVLKQAQRWRVKAGFS